VTVIAHFLQRFFYALLIQNADRWVVNGWTEWGHAVLRARRRTVGYMDDVYANACFKSNVAEPRIETVYSFGNCADQQCHALSAVHPWALWQQTRRRKSAEFILFAMRSLRTTKFSKC
jgi:hypothetical protein